MARRKRRRKSKLKISKPDPQTILALGLIIVGIISFFSIFGLTRSVLNGFSQQLKDFWGWGIFFFPFLSILSGFYFLGFKEISPNLQLLVGSSLILLSMLGITALISPTAGGTLGASLANNLNQLFTPIGTFLILLVTTIISFQIITNSPWEKILSASINTAKNLTAWLKTNLIDSWEENLKQRRAQHAVESIGLSDKEAELKNLKINGVSKGIKIIQTKTPKARKSRSETSKPVTQITIEEESADITELTKDTISKSDHSPTTLSSDWQYPPISLLSDIQDTTADRGDIEKNALTIKQTLKSFGIEAGVAEVNLGPTVTQYALDLAEGTKVSRVVALQNDLALALATTTGTVRIEAPIPGRSLIGVEVPNKSAAIVTLRSVLASGPMQRPGPNLTLPLGLDVAGKTIVANAAKWPHVLIAGATGSGKSVLLHTFVCTLLFKNSPQELKLILVDPKRVELTQYDGLPHLLTPVITRAEKVIPALKWAVAEMEKRYEKLQQARVRDIDGYNQANEDRKIPYITIIVDELADIMALAANEVERLICRIAQMSRATGIHLILSTQRPSVDVLTGLIKANIPARIALNVSSNTDSRVIIDATGAEKLLGRGDMLYLPPDRAKPIRIQGVFVSPKEIKSLLNFTRTENANYSSDISDSEEEVLRKPESQIVATPAVDDNKDPLFKEAVRIILNHKRASASLLQRRLSIGYARAARLLDELEETRIVSAKDGSKPREVFVVRAHEYLKGSTVNVDNKEQYT